MAAAMYRFQFQKLLSVTLKSPPNVCRASYSTSKTPTEPPKKVTKPQASKGKPSGESQVTSGNTYESGQYYQHNEFTYYDIENDMLKSRVGQPPSPRAGEHC
ncbi:uncharacterized protein LOC117105362 [Anneissia japonica]|uniref:uncharacterized protein LOC117105362 n=1 Tax=Anneissia japonica TaxID=1529436 RepID=UPI0014254C45|nr:uncharacterized protein LOC117105362 [Anneissia japonica]